MKRKLLWLGRGVVALVLFCQISFAQSFLDADPKLPLGTFSVADFDADGAMDVMLFVASTNNSAMLYRNTNGIAFARAPLPATSTIGTYSTIIWGDDNGDGLLDFAMTRTNSAGNFRPHFSSEWRSHLRGARSRRPGNCRWLAGFG